MDIGDIKTRCCFTGHRVLESDFNAESVYISMKTLVNHYGIDTFICGGALGFDMEVGYLVLKLKEELKNVKLWLFLPCTDQDARWSESDKKRRKYLIKHADLVDCPDTTYNSTVMRTRNYKMVDHSCFCVTYFHGKQISGTAQTLRYAKRLGRKILNTARDGKRVIDEL